MTAMRAIVAGQNKSLINEREERAKYELAFRTALSLANPGRLSKSTVDYLNRTIIDAIGSGSSEIERETKERLLSDKSK